MIPNGFDSWFEGIDWKGGITVKDIEAFEKRSGKEVWVYELIVGGEQEGLHNNQHQAENKEEEHVAQNQSNKRPVDDGHNVPGKSEYVAAPSQLLFRCWKAGASMGKQIRILGKDPCPTCKNTDVHKGNCPLLGKDPKA